MRPHCPHHITAPRRGRSTAPALSPGAPRNLARSGGAPPISRTAAVAKRTGPAQPHERRGLSVDDLVRLGRARRRHRQLDARRLGRRPGRVRLARRRLVRAGLLQRRQRRLHHARRVPCNARRKQPPARSPWRVDPPARRDGTHACCTGRDVLAKAAVAELPSVLSVVGMVGQWVGVCSAARGAQKVDMTCCGDENPSQPTQRLQDPSGRKPGAKPGTPALSSAPPGSALTEQ